MRILQFALAWIALTTCVGCSLANAGPDASPDGGDGDTESGSGGGDADSDADSDSASDADTDADGDADGDSDSDTGSGTADTDQAPGVCKPAGDLVPAEPIVSSTVDGGNAIERYDCSLLDESGPDRAYRYANPLDMPVKVTVTLTGLEEDLDLFLLLGECADDACAEHSAGLTDEEASLVLQPGETLFAVVDGYVGAAGNFTLQLEAHTFEWDCSNGVDDNEDSATDCGDADCALEPACGDPCWPDAVSECGQIYTWTTSGLGSTIDFYPDWAYDMSGPERVFSLAGADGVAVRAYLVSESADLDILGLVGLCSSTALVAASPTAIGFGVEAGETYFIVVDGRDGTCGDFTLRVECLETFCADGIDNDTDAATDCDDADCAMDLACVEICDLLGSAHCEAAVPDLDAGLLDGGTAPDASAGPEMGCYLASAVPLVSFCHEAGQGGIGDYCLEAWDCAPGLVCAPPDICLAYCDLSDNLPGCPAGTVCTHVGAYPLGLCW